MPTSQITTSNIDGTYPIAGQDNDSQGFRDNFTNIKNNFAFTKSELQDLFDNVVVKSPLSGETGTYNNMNGAEIAGAVLSNTSETQKDLLTTSGTVTLNMALGNCQKVILDGSATLSFGNFAPEPGQIGRIRLEITINNTAHTLTLPVEVTKGLSYIKGLQDSVLYFDATGTYQFEFISDDQGESITMVDLTRGKIQAINRTPTGTGQDGDIAGMMTYDSGFLYVCIGNYDGVTVIWKKATLNTI
jgi:hypothetical protein